MMLRFAGVVLLVCLAASCREDTGPTSDEACRVQSLPLSGGPEAPLVTAVSLEVEGSDIIARVSVTDPQGPENLSGVSQRISVFTDRRCEGAPLELTGTVTGSGGPENLGIVVTFADNQALYNVIVSSLTWPVGVSFEDTDGNRTMGRVQAPVQ